MTRTRESKKKGAKAPVDGEEELSSIATDDEDEEMVDADEDEDEKENDALAAREVVQAPSSKEQNRKRKRGERGDDLESTYMRRIEKEEDRENKKRAEEDAKRRKVVKPTNGEGDEEEEEVEASADEDDAEESSDEDISPPAHESLTPEAIEAAAIEKSARTVFLGNVSSQAIKSKTAKKTLLAHLSSFFPALVETSRVAPKIESIRFRSTAFSTTVMPKRAAYAKREVMDATTRSTNAYVVYNTVPAARRALTLNGSIVLDRHLRVDSVAHPAKQDYKRCVFVGNLGFVDELTAEDDEGNKKKKQREPADSEEGLWRTFNEHVKIASSKDPKSKKSTTDSNDSNNKAKGVVESVRVIRDSATRVSKGFAYVQFYDENAVEAALLLNEKKYPPLLPRILRITRAKRVTSKPTNASSGPKNTRMDERQSSMAGRAGKLFGRAGAAGAARFQKDASGRFNKSATGSNASALGAAGAAGAEKMVFEGFRASEKSGKFNVKTKSRGAKTGGGKPKTKSAKRAKAWKEKKF